MVTTKSFPCHCAANLEELYHTLIESGISPEEIDKGYYDIYGNYVGEDNDVIEGEEVLGYLYKNWQKYQPLLASKGFVVPWSFDDLDPKTDFDGRVRQNAKGLIDRVSSSVADVKTSQGEAEFKMALTYGIFNEASNDPFFLRDMVPIVLKKDDDPDFAKFGCPAYDAPKELTALELLQTKIGTCSEATYVLMGLYYMAGLNVRAINVTVAGDGEFMDHVALQVEIDTGHFVIVDPSLQRFNTHYRGYIPLSPAEFAGVYYSDISAADQKDKDSYWKAGVLYPGTGILNTAFQYFREGRAEAGLAALRRIYTDMADPRPDVLSLAYLRERGNPSEYSAYLSKVREKYPDIVRIINNYLSKKFSLGYFGMAGILSTLFDLARTEEERRDVLNLAAAFYILSGDLEKGHPIIQGLMQSGVVNEGLFNTYAYSLCRSKRFDDYYEVVRQWYSRFPHSVRAREYVMITSLAKGDFDNVIQAGVSLWNEEMLGIAGLRCLATAYAKKGEPKAAADLVRDYVISHKIEDVEAKRQLFSLCAIFGVAAGNYEHFAAYYKRATAIRKSNILEIIDFYLRGEIEKAHIAKELFIKKDDGSGALRDFSLTFDFLPKDLLKFLSQV